MEMVFKSGNELVVLNINRTTKELVINSSKTNYQPKKVSYSLLFDKGKEKIQESITDKYNDNEFATAITHSFSIVGYQRIKSTHEKIVELPKKND
jgi:hypothetical protein